MLNCGVHLEQFRREALRHSTSLKGVQKSIPIWSSLVKSKLSTNPTSQEILNISQHLRDIFTATSISGRSQSAVSVAGSSWQTLVMWYLNMIFVGTDCVVIPPIKKFRPQVLEDATDVKMNGRSSNTETDLLAFTVPKHQSLSNSKTATINNLINQDIGSTRVTIIQCKTNWNDNAQIPMLWNQIYELARAGNRFAQLSVGTHYQPSQFKDFTYAFVTVPTIKLVTKSGKNKFNPQAVAVQRVSGMTGGNYWGLPSSPAVAESLDSFFNRNFATSFAPSGIQSFIQNRLIPGTYGFGLNEFLDFTF